jgi:hypothetical protein
MDPKTQEPKLIGTRFSQCLGRFHYALQDDAGHREIGAERHPPGTLGDGRVFQVEG